MKKVLLFLIIFIFFATTDVMAKTVSCWYEFNTTQNPANSTMVSSGKLSSSDVVKVGTIAFGLTGVNYDVAGGFASYVPFFSVGGFNHQLSYGWKGSSCSYGYLLREFDGDSCDRASRTKISYAHHYCIVSGSTTADTAAVNYIIKAK